MKPEVVDPESDTGPDREAAPPRGLFGASAVPSPYPGLRETLARGSRAAASHASAVVASFIFVLILWGLVSAVGDPPDPREMALFMSHPVVGVVSDVNMTLRTVPAASLASFAILFGLLVLRSTLVVFLLSRILAAIRGEVPPDMRWLARRVPSMMAVNAALLGIVLSSLLVVAGFLGEFGSILVWGLGLYFLAMAPVIVVAEGGSAADALRGSIRAARLPGQRHLVIVLLYLFLLVLFSLGSPGGLIPPATPSLAVWVTVLVQTFVHVVVLGGLAHRWVSVRDRVSLERATRRRSGEGTR